MKKRNLLESLSALGFPLFEVEQRQDANLTLADVVESEDLRLWEGFPVVLANSAQKGLFDYKIAKRNLKKPLDKSRLDSLIAMSLALYYALNLKFSWANRLYKILPTTTRKEINRLLKKLRTNEDFKIAGHLMSSQRVKSTFNNYFAQSQSRLSEFLSMKEELGLEYALSQVFPPKQKELFLKKLKGEKLTKTEKEYFSRVVKKKALALANPELHRLSQRLLE